MPVKKISEKTEVTTSSTNGRGYMSQHDMTKKLFLTFAGILIVYAIVFLGTLIRNNIKAYDSIGVADKPERTILIEGQGKITAKPDIAMTNMGVIAEGATVEEAQTKSTEVMNKLSTRLAQIGIAKEDIQTSQYNIYPMYTYDQVKGNVLTGYQVSQNVEIKIRDLQKAQTVLALAGEVGANSVSGLQFTIDDKQVYLDQARQEALDKVGKKAKAISKSLGVRMVGIATYNEYEVGNGNPMPYLSAVKNEAMGGSTPTVETGTNEVIMNVSVVFEIR